MPLPPVHGLAVLLLYFKRKDSFDPLALVASATVVDLEPLYYVLVGEVFSHRVWHGYALALTVYPILVALAVFVVERFFGKQLWSAYSVLRLKPEKTRYSLLSIYLCCLVGGFSHVFFDMFTHQVMPYVVYPLFSGNPFYLGWASGIVESAAIILAAYSVYCWFKMARSESPK